MKRSMGGGARRGPVAHNRQRKTIRFVQLLLVLLAAGLLVFAGYSAGRRSGYDAGLQAAEEAPPRRPAVAQTVVLSLLGLGALAAAVALQGGGDVRIPTPARLDELAGRAESAALQRAEELAAENNPT
jgi:TRAP-type C4-dicarboxylate transport system permease small subunit